MKIGEKNWKAIVNAAALLLFSGAIGLAIVIGAVKGQPIPSEIWNVIYTLLGGGAVAAAVKLAGKGQ